MTQMYYVMSGSHPRVPTKAVPQTTALFRSGSTRGSLPEQETEAASHRIENYPTFDPDVLTLTRPFCMLAYGRETQLNFVLRPHTMEAARIATMPLSLVALPG